MSLTPEIKRGLPVEERLEQFPEIPPEVENKSIPLTTAIPTQVKPVYDEYGNPLIQTPQTQVITIKIPKAKQVYTTIAKGSVAEAPTWDAKYWLRQIAKALLWGWRLIFGGGQNDAT